MDLEIFFVEPEIFLLSLKYILLSLNYIFQPSYILKLITYFLVKLEIFFAGFQGGGRDQRGRWLGGGKHRGRRVGEECGPHVETVGRIERMTIMTNDNSNDDDATGVELGHQRHAGLQVPRDGWAAGAAGGPAGHGRHTRHDGLRHGQGG